MKKKLVTISSNLFFSVTLSSSSPFGTSVTQILGDWDCFAAHWCSSYFSVFSFFFFVSFWIKSFYCYSSVFTVLILWCLVCFYAYPGYFPSPTLWFLSLEVLIGRHRIFYMLKHLYLFITYVDMYISTYMHVSIYKCMYIYSFGLTMFQLRIYFLTELWCKSNIYAVEVILWILIQQYSFPLSVWYSIHYMRYWTLYYKIGFVWDNLAQMKAKVSVLSMYEVD